MQLALIFLSALAVAEPFSTSLGDQYPYTISAIATDAVGNTYIVGSRQIGVPTLVGGIVGAAAPKQIAANGATSDVFVSKLDPNGNLVFTDTFAGKGTDHGTAVAVDPSGNIYIAGTTTSSDFPLSNAVQTQSNALGTGFVLKLSKDGADILYSTYFGGTLGVSAVTALATDSQGNLYLTGTTTSTDFPHTPGLPFGPNPLATSNTAVFVACISASGDKILYSGALISGPIPVFSGTISPSSAGVAVDATGNAYFAGNVGGGAALPTTPGVLMPTGSFTGFAAKVNSGGTGLAYLTYLPNDVSGVALDTAGDLYLAGSTYSSRPSAPTFGYVSKLNPAGSAILWTDNFNDLAESAESIAVDSSGKAWVTGTTSSAAFPNQGWTTGPEFLAEINAAGDPVYSALYPQGTTDALAVDTSGLVHLAGSAGFVSTVSPAVAATMQITYFQNVFGGNVTPRISPAEVISIFGPGIGPSTAATAAPVNGFYAKALGNVQVIINGMEMPLLYASANQINAIVPMEIEPGAGATIRILGGSSMTPSFPVWIAPSEPQAFPTVLNQDSTINSQSNPAALNSVVSFYATGWQAGFTPLADGQVATAAQNICADSAAIPPGQEPCSVLPLNTVPSGVVLYVGAAPGIVAGVSQFNVEIYTNAVVSGTPGPYTFIVSGGGASVSQTVWVKF
jgi:uncharacterized protein (TIGR03437 family)